MDHIKGAKHQKFITDINIYLSILVVLLRLLPNKVNNVLISYNYIYIYIYIYIFVNIN